MIRMLLEEDEFKTEGFANIPCQIFYPNTSEGILESFAHSVNVQTQDQHCK
jgi:hypothetical protein